MLTATDQKPSKSLKCDDT